MVGANPPDPEVEAEWVALGRLSKAVQSALTKLEKDRKANEERIQASVHKMRWFRRVGVIGVIAGVLGIGVGCLGLYEVDKIYDQRETSRIITCKDQNDTASRINSLNDRSQKLLENAAATGNRTPEEQIMTDLFVSRELAEYEKIKVPKRNCSPDGIRDYYRSKK